MQQQVQGIIHSDSQRLLLTVSKIKRQLQGNLNWSTPVETDTGEVVTKSAKLSCKKSPAHNLAEADQNSALEAQSGTKTLHRRSVDARQHNNPALAPPSAAESGDSPRNTESEGSCKQGGRMSKLEGHGEKSQRMRDSLQPKRAHKQ